MSVTTEERPVVQKPADAPQESGYSAMQTVLIGVLVLAVAAMIAYQFLGCAGCYGVGYPI